LKVFLGKVICFLQGATVLRNGRASDALLRLLVCEHGLRSAAADAKVIFLNPIALSNPPQSH
jgi:hypothetical protein